MKTSSGKGLLAVILGVSLLVSAGTYVKDSEALEPLEFIEINLDNTLNPGDYPIGITCDDPDFVYATIFEQGLLARINKADTSDVVLINDPETFGGDIILQQTGQGFYSIARDTATGAFFVNEVGNGKIWRFDPSVPDATTNPDAWTNIPIIPEIVHPNITYPLTYPSLPVLIAIDEEFAGVGQVVFPLGANSKAGIVSTNGFIWVGLSFVFDFDDIANSIGIEDQAFSGIVRINPVTLEQTRIAIPGSIAIASLNLDSTELSMIWIADRGVAKIHKFDTNTLQVVQTIDLEPGSEPNHAATNESTIFVALNRPGDFGLFSEIAMIDRATLAITKLDTTAPNTNFGTFTVFVEGQVLAWTDQSGHIGMFDLSTREPTPILDEQTELPFITTGEFDQNHFGCNPKVRELDFEFWFASRGSAKVGKQPNSKFSVGGLKKATSTGSGDMGWEGIDTTPPSILESYSAPEPPSAGEQVIVNAKIIDEVGIDKATLHYQTSVDEYRKSYSVFMDKTNSQWYAAKVPSNHVSTPSFKYWITALDFGGNTAESKPVEVEVQQGISVSARASATNLPAHVLEAIKPKIMTPIEKLEVISMNGEDKIRSYPDEIIIKNVGDKTADNIRVMLSPEVSKSFVLSQTTIQSLEPNESVTITLRLNGNPSKDMIGDLVPYDGSLIVAAEHVTPLILPINIGGTESFRLSAHLAKIADMASLRYNKLSLLNSVLSSGFDEKRDFDISMPSESREVTTASDYITIKNASDRQLTNIRIVTSSLGTMILPDNDIIKTLAPNESVTVQLIPKIDSAKYSPRDYIGEIIVIADNGLPEVIPVRIAAAPEKNSRDEFQLYSDSMSTTSAVTTLVDRITIKNNADREMGSVKLMFTNSLERVLQPDYDSVSGIAPNEEITINMTFRPDIREKKELFMQNYMGEITVVSEHHNSQSIPVKIQWNKVESEHFTVYARTGQENVATEVIEFLESAYVETTARLGPAFDKTTIYIAGNEQEMKFASESAHSYYSYADDTAFICSCDDPKYNALKQFTYRLMVNNHANYYNMQALRFENENWLLDGMASYIAMDTADQGMLVEDVAFMNDIMADDNTNKLVNGDDALFEWTGSGSDIEYSATFDFLNFLENEYGSKVIDVTIESLGFGLTINHKCSSVEECVVLNSVYEVQGWDLDKRRFDLTFEDLANAWKDSIESRYAN
jgi:hypothetical protein